MKALAAIVLLSISISAGAQVIFRNDFVLGKHNKLKNKGISFIAINFGHYPNANLLVNGKGGKSLVIDVQAVRNPNRFYSYQDLAERIYTPGPVYRPNVEPVPRFLLSEPPGLKWYSLGPGWATPPRSRSFREQ